MYNYTFIQGLAHLEKKGTIKDATVYEEGTPNLTEFHIKYIKSHIPKFTIGTTPEDVWLGLGAKSFTNTEQHGSTNRKYDIVCSTDSFDRETDPASHITSLWTKVRKGGLLFVDVPTSTTSGFFSFSTNWIAWMKRLNGFEVPYSRISDKTGQYSVIPDSDTVYSMRDLNEKLLYKFKETSQLRLTFMLRKLESAPLMFKSEVVKETK